MLALLDDHGFEDVSQTDKLNFLNDSLSNLCGLHPWPFLEDELTLAFDGASKTATNAPTDLRAVLKITYSGQNRRVRPIRLDDLDETYGESIDTVGDPFRYYFLGSQLRFVYVPTAATTLRLRYLKYHTLLTASTAEANILVPPRKHLVLVYGALVPLYMLDDDDQMASQYQALFDRGVAQMHDELFRRQYDESDFIHQVDDWDYFPNF